MKTETYQCKHCKSDFTARIVDRERGWARFCSKSCKAKAQEKQTGQYSAYKASRASGGSYRDYDGGTHPFDPEAFGNKEW